MIDAMSNILHATHSVEYDSIQPDTIIFKDNASLKPMQDALLVQCLISSMYYIYIVRDRIHCKCIHTQHRYPFKTISPNLHEKPSTPITIFFSCESDDVNRRLIFLIKCYKKTKSKIMIRAQKKKKKIKNRCTILTFDKTSSQFPRSSWASICLTAYTKRLSGGEMMYMAKKKIWWARAPQDQWASNVWQPLKIA